MAVVRDTKVRSVVSSDEEGRYVEARKKRDRLSLDEAHDLFRTVWERCVRAFDCQKPFSDFRSYYYTALRHEIPKVLDPKHRMLVNRYNSMLQREVNKGRLAVWYVSKQRIVGLSRQDATPAALYEDCEEIKPRMADFEDYLARDPEWAVIGNSDRMLTRLFLMWLGRPAAQTLILDLLGPRLQAVKWRKRGVFERLRTPKKPQHPYHAWDRILRLPPRYRAVILLQKSDEELRELYTNARKVLPQVIPAKVWRPPPPLDMVEGAIPDEMIAEKLGTSRGNVHVMRKRANDQLVRMGALLA
ncbi:hypothetical protein EON82_20805 [bacterium]|nr:MAG: hypothetical protein EON82_20805 [bacterium]